MTAYFFSLLHIPEHGTANYCLRDRVSFFFNLFNPSWSCGLLWNGTLVLMKQETKMHLHVKASFENLPVLMWTRSDLRDTTVASSPSPEAESLAVAWLFLLISKRETKDKRKIPLKSDFGEPKSIFRLIKGAWLTHGPLYHQNAHSSMITWESLIPGPLFPSLQEAPAKSLLFLSNCLMLQKRVHESWNFLKFLRLANFLSSWVLEVSLFLEVRMF